MQIDRSSLSRRAVSRTPRVYAPSKLIGLHPPYPLFSPPTAITRIYISARARVRVSCVNFVITWVAGTVRPTPAISHQPSGRAEPSRAALSKRPDRFRRGVSNVCERDEMQTGAILFIVRRLYTYRALPLLGRLGMTPGTDSICFTTEKRPRRN